MKNNNLITVGFDKNGEADFGVDMSVASLSQKKRNALRTKTMVAIGRVERIWSDSNQEEAYEEGKI